jgi:hypothetical protein
MGAVQATGDPIHGGRVLQAAGLAAEPRQHLGQVLAVAGGLAGQLDHGVLAFPLLVGGFFAVLGRRVLVAAVPAARTAAT